MIYYSVLYPPLVPITLPAFELNRNDNGEEDRDARWKLYFEPSVGNKISDFKGGFIRIRSAEAEVSIFQGNGTSYLYDLIPFRNPYAEYTDPYNQNSTEGLQPEGYAEGMPAVKLDESNNTYYIDVPHKVFNEVYQKDIRFKAQIMFTKDWVSSEYDSGEGVISTWNDEDGYYEPLVKADYFGGNLVQKGLSEWSRVVLLSPVSEANYELIFNYIEVDEVPVGYINSPIYEYVGTRTMEHMPQGIDGNAIQGYRISIHSNVQNKPAGLVDTSGWIVGQENANLEIRWQNQVEIENKTYYWVKLEVQTVWDLRKEFWILCYSDFEASLFQGSVRAVNDHDKARVKIIINAKSPLTWGPRTAVEIDPAHAGFIKVKDSVESKDIRIEQGIDLTTKNGSFAAEMIVANIKPITDWEEDETRYFYRMSGPELSIQNPYQEEYVIYAHSVAISDTIEYEVYEEDVIINPVLSGPNNKTHEVYMSPTGHIDMYLSPSTTLGNPADGGLATVETEAPASHSYVLLLDSEEKIWRVSVALDGSLTTSRAFNYQVGEVQQVTPVYLYDKHNLYIKRLGIGTDGVLRLEGRAIHFDRDKAVKPMYINEFRIVKKVWGLQLGRKVLIGKQTYKAFMNDFNRKLGKWMQINPMHQYYIYFASTKGQLYMYVRDLTAQSLDKNFIDRYNLNFTTGSSALPESGLFITTNGLNVDYVPIRDEKGNYIKYVISVDEKGSLVSDIAYVGTSTTTQKSILE